MTREEARNVLRSLAQAATPPVLSDDELDAALTASRLPDNEDRPPSDPDFVEENWDLNYAVADCFLMKHAKQLAAPTILEFTAEGARFKKVPPDFAALADWYRDRSTVGDSSSPVMIELDNRPPWRLRPRSSWSDNDG